MPNEVAVSQDALLYAAARYGRPDWAKGTISRPDAAFLFEMLMRERPRTVAEIGVASGTSTAFLSTLLADRLPKSELFAFDALQYVYNEPAKPVGAYIRELFGRLPDNVTLKAGMASYGIRGWQDRPDIFDFVFLDADHEHPWPCLDLLSLVDVVKPGAWIVLHDIALPLLSGEARTFGPMYLHQNWPGEKCVPAGGNANIGAIRLFENPAESARALIACAALPWHVRPHPEAWRSAIRAVADVDGDANELRALVERPRLANRVAMKRCAITMRGANSWSRMAADLVSEPLTLQANLLEEPAASVVVSGLDTRRCHGLIAPYIARAPEASVAVRARLSLRTPDGPEGPSVEFILKDGESRSAYLLVPREFEDAFEIEIRVAPAEKTATLHGAWVKFKMLHFV